jgi:hypothetical protein
VLKQINQVRIVYGQDRITAVRCRLNEANAAGCLECSLDLGDALRPLEARDRLATHDLHQTVMGEMRARGDDRDQV